MNQNTQQRAVIELTIAHDALIEALARSLDLREHETPGHTQRVAHMTVQLARSLRMPDSDLPDVRRGALLHDIGKMQIPEIILFKTGPLNDAEWLIMRLHPQYVYDLLSPIAYLHNALDIPYHHHEKWDGTGYPAGLTGEDIPLSARLFAVVDVWDSMTSERP